MSNNIFFSLGIALVLSLTVFSCKKQIPPKPKDLLKESIIPLPSEINATNSSFTIDEATGLFYTSESEQLAKLSDYFSNWLKNGSGLNLKVSATKNLPISNYIYLALADSIAGEEAYQIVTDEKGIKIIAGQPHGIFNGLQTLKQLLPAHLHKGPKENDTLRIATGTIKDAPEYGYRGVMLDVSRHFFGVDVIKKFIDYLALYKINRLHLHLSDDQGWRIEIKSWPKLTEIGGQTQVGGGKGGFYTQEQYKEIVQYAADRFITIVPEIDMPGHTNAALVSYPELNCDGKARKPYTGTNVGFSTLCTDKEITYKFIDDVIRELAALTPGEYIHIGGDESNVTPMKDYIPFINRTQKIVEKHGKKVIGWDEIAHADLLPNTIVQYWSKGENAIKGIAQGSKVLMSPAKKAYLDMKYDSISRIGLHWAAFIPVDVGYKWDLETYEEGISKADIIGIEAPLWTETVETPEDIEYLVFPRLLGISEIGWTPTAKRNWEEYKVRLANHDHRLKAMDIGFYASKTVPWKE